MKTIIISKSKEDKYPRATHVDKNGKKFLLTEVIDNAQVFGTCVVKEGKTISDIEKQMNLTALEIPENLKPKPKILRSISKLELINKLVELSLENQFYSFLSTLPTSEKLRWDAAQTISPAYSFIVDNKQSILSSLGLSEEQFNNIFR